MADNPLEYVLHPELAQGSQDDSPASGQPAEQRKYAGKYETVDELERGYWNQAEETRRILEENRELRMRQDNLDEGFQRRDTPAERRAAREYMSRLADAGVPIDDLQLAIQEGVRSVVQPLVQGASAREEMLREYPEFAQVEPKVAQFLETHPDLRARFQASYGADQRVAMEWAYAQYRRAEQPSSASGREQSAARLDAQLPQRNADRTASTTTDAGAVDREQYDAAMKYAQQTGDWAQVIKMHANMGVMKNQ